MTSPASKMPRRMSSASESPTAARRSPVPSCICTRSPAGLSGCTCSATRSARPRTCRSSLASTVTGGSPAAAGSARMASRRPSTSWKPRRSMRHSGTTPEASCEGDEHPLSAPLPMLRLAMCRAMTGESSPRSHSDAGAPGPLWAPARHAGRSAGARGRACSCRVRTHSLSRRLRPPAPRALCGERRRLPYLRPTLAAARAAARARSQLRSARRASAASCRQPIASPAAPPRLAAPRPHRLERAATGQADRFRPS